MPKFRPSDGRKFRNFVDHGDQSVPVRFFRRRA